MRNKKKNHPRKLSAGEMMQRETEDMLRKKQLWRIKKLLNIVAAIMVIHYIFPAPLVRAQEEINNSQKADLTLVTPAEVLKEDPSVNPPSGIAEEEELPKHTQLPKNTEVKVVKIEWITVTAYSSSPEETDGDPFTMADGKHVYFGAIATNNYPFGTVIRFPEIFGDKTFRVEDRMNKRYNGVPIVDVWHPSKKAARQFGSKVTKMEVLGN